MRRDDIEQAADRDFNGCAVAGLALFVVVMLVVLGLMLGPLVLGFAGPDRNADVRWLP